MSKAQEIFCRVIKKGYYKVDPKAGKNLGMCWALRSAVNDRGITQDEYVIASQAICKYLGRRYEAYLHHALPKGVEQNSQRHYPEVYKNWDHYSTRKTLWGVIKGWFK